MTIRAIVSHDEIIKAVVAYLENNSSTFSGGIPEDAVLKIVDIGASTYEVAISFGETLDA